MKLQPSKSVGFVGHIGWRDDDEGEEEGRVGALLQGEEKEERRPCKFTRWNEVVLLFSVTFYIADLCLDLWVCAAHFKTRFFKSGWFIFFCILLPNLYAGYKSLQWYLRAHEQYPIRRPVVWIVRVLFFPISPILRYIDAWTYGRRARRHWYNKNYTLEQRNFENYLMEIAEVALLRLVIIFLEDAPIVVLNLAKLLQMPPSTFTPGSSIIHDQEQDQDQVQLPKQDNITGIAVYPPTTPLPPYDPYALTVLAVRLGSIVAKLTCTMTLGVVHYVSCNKLAWHLANTQQRTQTRTDTPRGRGGGIGGRGGGGGRREISFPAAAHKKGVLSWGAEVMIYSWQLLAIGSRVMAYAMLWVTHFTWLWLPITLRWLTHALWIYFDVPQMSFVNSIAFGGVYLFSFVTTSPGRQILRIALYYTITLSEHLIVALLWHSSAHHNPYHNLCIGILFGGALGGLLCLMLYYGLCHPDRDNTWLWHYLRKRREARGVREVQGEE